jgi:endonuclease/exonuclease/phosphatase (EEP) superfamily protein YafD
MHEPDHNTNPPPMAERPSAVRVWLKRGLLGLGLCVLIATGAATLAAFNARQGWRWELLCHFRVQYFWALLAATALFVCLRHWFLAASAAVLATANLALIVPLYFGGGDVPAAGKTVRVLSLNVHFLNRDFEPTLALIRREKPDVILLMEFTPAWAEAINKLAAEYPYSHEIPRHSPAGIALLSRHEITDLEIHELHDVRLPTVIAGIATPSGRLTVVGTHPASPGSPEHFDARNRQLAEVAKLAGERSGPVVLIGDLNCTSWSPYFADLLQVSQLRDSRLGYGVEPTWPWFPLPLRIPIDHGLVSREVSVVDRRVGPAVGSDHRPILLDLAF